MQTVTILTDFKFQKVRRSFKMKSLQTLIFHPRLCAHTYPLCIPIRL